MVSSLASVIPAADRVRWELEEVAAGVELLDVGRPFLPTGLVHADAAVVRPHARLGLALNQLRAHGYLEVMGFLKRAVLPPLLGSAGPALFEDAEDFWAVLRVAEGEAKHLVLFDRFRAAVETSFRAPLPRPEGTLERAAQVLGEEPLAVALLAAHVSFLAQEHYGRSQRDPGERDPCFGRLLKAHWQEQAVHGRVALRRLAVLRERSPAHAAQRGFEGYGRLLRWLDARLGERVERDLDVLATLGELDEGLRDRLRTDQRASQRDVFLAAGLRHPQIKSLISQHFSRFEAALEALEASFAVRP